MKYFPKNIAIDFRVPSGMTRGDYVRLFGNGGSGAVNYTTPLDSSRYDLFRGDSGLFGWSKGRWGHHTWGRQDARGVNGWGKLKWGDFGWGYGAAEINIVRQEQSPATYIYAFQAYDTAGNLDTGTPDEEAALVCPLPKRPLALKRNSYNSTTDVITFTIPSPIQE